MRPCGYSCAIKLPSDRDPHPFRVFNYVADQRPALLYAPGQAPQPQFRDRLVPNQAWRAALGTALSAGILLLWAVGLGPLIEAGWQLSLTARMLLTALVTAPTGYFMGFAFPGGISWLKRTDAPAVPWSVGLNAFGSVWGSVAAVPLSLLLGYSWVFGIGVGLYLIACLSALSMARSDPARARPTTPAPVDGALLL